MDREYVTTAARPCCGWPVSDEMCDRDATHWIELDYHSGGRRRVYRCASHAARVPYGASVRASGSVVVED